MIDTKPGVLLPCSRKRVECTRVEIYSTLVPKFSQLFQNIIFKQVFIDVEKVIATAAINNQTDYINKETNHNVKKRT